MNKSKKVLYINSFYPPDVGGGAELSLQLIVEGIQNSGFEVAVLVTGSKPGRLVEWKNGVRVYRVGIKNNYWPLSQRRPGKWSRMFWHVRDVYNTAMAQYVDEVLHIEEPDIISCHNLSCWSIATWKVLASYGKPIVQVLHDLYLLCPNCNMFKDGRSCAGQCIFCKTMRLGHRKASGKVDAVVGISQYILDKFSTAGYFEKASRHLIYNSRDISVSPTVRYRQSGEPLRVGYIGTLGAAKGVEWLLTSMMKTTDQDISLQIAGKGQMDYEFFLKHKCRADTRITFIGFVPSVIFYRDVDVLVVPSLWEEPLGMVAIEACARSIPVITSGRGGLKEIITDGKNGLIIEPGDIEALMTAILRLKSDTDLYNQLKQNTRSSVATFLHSERLVEQYKQVYSEVTSKNADK